MLTAVEGQARAGRLPGYLPDSTDVVAVTRTVKVREGLRAGHSEHHAGGPTDEERRYALAGDRAGE